MPLSGVFLKSIDLLTNVFRLLFYPDTTTAS